MDFFEIIEELLKQYKMPYKKENNSIKVDDYIIKENGKAYLENKEVCLKIEGKLLNFKKEPPLTLEQKITLSFVLTALEEYRSNKIINFFEDKYPIFGRKAIRNELESKINEAVNKLKAMHAHKTILEHYNIRPEYNFNVLEQQKESALDTIRYLENGALITCKTRASYSITILHEQGFKIPKNIKKLIKNIPLDPQNFFDTIKQSKGRIYCIFLN